jgi:hypothetical protein
MNVDKMSAIPLSYERRERRPTSMKKMPKALQKLPEYIADKAAKILEDGEREVYSLREITDWKGLSKGERQILIGIRKHMRERTSMKGSKGWTSATAKQIANFSGYEERQARRLVKSLKSKEVLEVIGKDKGPGSRRGYAIHKQSCCYRNTQAAETQDGKPVPPNPPDEEHPESYITSK